MKLSVQLVYNNICEDVLPVEKFCYELFWSDEGVVRQKEGLREMFHCQYLVIHHNINENMNTMNYCHL